MLNRWKRVSLASQEYLLTKWKILYASVMTLPLSYLFKNDDKFSADETFSECTVSYIATYRMKPNDRKCLIYRKQKKKQQISSN